MKLLPEHLKYVFSELRCKCVRCNSNLQMSQRISGQAGAWELVNVQWDTEKDIEACEADYMRAVDNDSLVNLDGFQLYCQKCFGKINLAQTKRYKGVNYKPTNKGNKQR
jgi:hypothetical protein